MRTGPVGALIGLLLLVVTACTGSSQAEEPEGGEERPSPSAAALEIAITPEDGATGVATAGELRVGATNGTLTAVTVTGPEGAEVPGELAEDGTSWEPAEHLANAAEYTVTAVGENADGEESTKTATFTTVVADATFTSNWNIADGATVGVGMVLSLTFDTPIEDISAVRDAVRITTEPEVDVRGHWFGTQRLDFRPEEYWEPGTEVTVGFRIRGVEGAPGVYGTLYEDITFTVGRSQVTTVDAEAMRMEVVRDGESIRTLPVTTGAPGTPTWNGKMVITEKHKETRMDGATVGFGGEYDIPDVPHAMRLSTSGTFIHGNYWASGSTFGNENASHGCVGLEDERGAGDSSTPAAWFYDNSIIGDVVEVINSDDDVIAPDNGLNGWNMAWDQWGAGQ
ncbi:L,D-transpeptidase [Streptomyces litchfieldiae]|uniref:Ig-like domain-containing protein n=1 Tax=Streptomyces litchfieldiae TaxID=3075543 RepID=A0ABU2MI99_9ACTN|nr:Ig-like domain-containing protein [Streptomyces sp. DSM 44938]MDT0341313.1 Ig-like domain-containing protein [Streptomyces sp. DSM 44938]